MLASRCVAHARTQARSGLALSAPLLRPVVAPCLAAPRRFVALNTRTTPDGNPKDDDHYINPVSQQIEEIGDGWFALENYEGRAYYHHKEKKITTWEHPVTGHIDPVPEDSAAKYDVPWVTPAHIAWTWVAIMSGVAAVSMAYRHWFEETQSVLTNRPTSSPYAADKAGRRYH